MTAGSGDYLPVIRPMRPGDIESVFAVETSAYDYPWTLTIFRDCLRMGYECWVQLATDKIVGHFVLAMGPGEAHVLNLAVHPQWNNRGLGRALLRRALDQAERLGAESVYLEVRPSNTPAVHLYRSQGFRRVGRRRDYYPTIDGREDAFVMRYDLREVAPAGRQ